MIHMKSTVPSPTEPGPRLRISASLVILRVALGVFLLVWGRGKFFLTPRSIAIYDYFYGITASEAFAYSLGGLESLLALAIMIGAFRRWSYGIGLLAHSATTVATFRLIVDPWGLISGEPQHLYFAAIPILAGFIVLYLLRDLDYFSFDGWRARKLSPV